MSTTTPETSRLAAVEAERDQLKRGGKELGKTLVFLAELIKDAYVRGAGDPIDALQMLGNYLAEVFEDEGGLSDDEHNRVYRALEDRRVKVAKDHDELRDKRTDLLNIRGVLSPQDRSLGLGPVVPMPLGKEVAPAVEWLANEADRLRAKLDQPCGSCHPCTNYRDETWRAADRKPPHVHEWDELRAESERLREENARLRAEIGRPLTANERAYQDGV